MKKITMLLAATMFLLCVSGQAMAYFADGDLVRVVYSSNGTIESATDLGSVTSLTTNTGANVVYNTNNFSMGQLGGTASFADSSVAYFTLLNTQTAKSAWLSGAAGTESAAKSGWSGFVTSEHYALQSGYQLAGGTSAAMVTLAMSDPNSYYNQLNIGGAGNGTFAGYLISNNGEASLANLAGVGYVDQQLYYYSSASGLSGSATGLNVATIRTYADGHTELNPAVTTAPPVLSEQFGAASIPLNSSTTLSFTVQNNNATSALTGVGFVDTLPAGLVVSTPNGLAGSCGGGTITANAGANGISLSGASLAQSSSCTFSVNVKGIAAGVQTNTTGNVTSNEGGNGNAATAPLTVTSNQPIVSSTTPLNNAVGVAPNGTISITWDKNIDCTTVNTTTITINNSASLSSPTCSGQTATFPVSGQTNNSMYTVAVGTGVKDSSGNNMAAAYSFSYATYDTVPDVFTFSAQTGVALSTVVESNPITVAGISYQTPISISGGAYQINGGGWTNTSGTVNPGDTVKVRVTSSGSYSTTTTATLTVGGVIGTFSVTTTPLPAYVLTVNASGTGSGTVTSTTGGISYTYSATQTQSASLTSGTAVTLTATATGGSRASWTGSCDSTGGTVKVATCTINSISAPETVTANFVAPVWQSIPGAIVSPPALAWNPVSNKIQMVVRGTGDTIWSATFNSDGTFNSDWVQIPGAIVSPPALAWNPVSNKLQMVVRGTGDTIWSSTFNSNGTFNSDWVQIPGAIVSPPALAWNPVSNKLQMVVRGTGDTIWSSTFNSNGTFNSDWAQIPGAIISPPALVWNSLSNDAQLVVQGSGNTIWSSTFNSDGTFNSDWAQIPGAIISPPALAWDPVSNNIQMLVRGSGDTIWTATFNSAGVFNGDWEQIPGAIIDPPAIVWNVVKGNLLIVVRGANNTIWAMEYY